MALTSLVLNQRKEREDSDRPKLVPFFLKLSIFQGLPTVEPLLAALIVAYLLIGHCFFTSWLEFFHLDTTLSSKERRLSVMILVVAAIAWPIVVPLAYLELLRSSKKSFKKPTSYSVIEEATHLYIHNPRRQEQRSTVEASEMTMTAEESQRLQACVREMATILYKNTPPSQLPALENVAKAVCQQMLEQVNPPFTLSYSASDWN